MTTILLLISLTSQIVGDGTVPMKISFGAQEPASPRHGAGIGKGAEPPFFLADCNAALLEIAMQRPCTSVDRKAAPRNLKNGFQFSKFYRKHLRLDDSTPMHR